MLSVNRPQALTEILVLINEFPGGYLSIKAKLQTEGSGMASVCPLFLSSSLLPHNSPKR